MPDINENNMEELFRRAAEQYPLRTDSADWNKVARALDDDDTGAAFLPESGNGTRKWMWLLLLLPLAAIGYFTLRPHSTTTLSDKNVVTNRSSVENSNDKKEITDNTKTANKNIAAEKQNTENSEIKNKPSGKILNTTDDASNTKSESSVKQNNIGEKNDRQLSASSQKSMLKIGAGNQTKNIFGKRTHGNKDVSFNPSLNNDRSDESLDATASTENKNILTGETRDINVQKGTLVAITPLKPVINLKDPGQKTSVPLNNANKPAAKNAKKNKYFYAGLVIAPDLSTVKFQSVKGFGYTAGILLGYKFSSKFSVETGAYFDSKKYYTSGEYFSAKNVPWLNYIDLKNVNGVCNMIDVPANLRFDFASGKKGSWFATTGLSTYFMFKENYTYDYEYSGSYQSRDVKYTKGSQNWFSIWNVSFGYDYKIGKSISLRAEPYLKVPLTGMGTGSLPIMSAGLNLGVVHRFK